MGGVGDWLIPVLAVVVLGGATLGFALFVGRWIDAQEPHNSANKGGKPKTDDSSPKAHRRTTDDAQGSK